MFTGIIEGTGRIIDYRRLSKEADCLIKVPNFFSDCKIGDSIAVNGVCLTITRIKEGLVSFDISAETLNKSTLGKIKQGEPVNLERALRLSDRLGGHLVSGHIDGTGIIEHIEKLQRSIFVRIGVNSGLSRQMIDKGSVAVDGISLTINSCMKNSFDVNIIPQTAEETTISSKRVGHTVNIETDLISKYIEKILIHNKPDNNNEKPSAINYDTLIRYGFGGNNGNL